MSLEQIHMDHSREATDFLGTDMEQAYCNVLGEFGSVQGGVGDGGFDFVSLDQRFFPNFQIKSSWPGAEKFFAESIRRKVFIPVAIGEPGDPKEMIESFRNFGGWVGKDEPLRKQYLQKIKILRSFLRG